LDLEVSITRVAKISQVDWNIKFSEEMFMWPAEIWPEIVAVAAVMSRAFVTFRDPANDMLPQVIFT
jgi:hypothetical protein